MINQNGQSVVEYLLILTILMAVSVTVSGYFRNNSVLNQLVQGPWVSLQGVIENGVPGDPVDGRSQHPNHLSRHISEIGDAEVEVE